MRVAHFLIPQMVMADFTILLLKSKLSYKISGANTKKEIILKVIYLRREMEEVSALEEELGKLIKSYEEGYIQCG